MDSAEAISAFRLVVAIVILGIASVLDVRTRKVENRYWIVMAVIGLALLPVQIAAEKKPWEYLVVLVPILAILSDVYWEAKPGTVLERYGPIMKYGVAIGSLVLIAYYWTNVADYSRNDQFAQHLLAVPILMILLVGMYMADIIRGGADAKALISLSVLFPVYPLFAAIPIFQPVNESATVFFPFAFSVLIIAALIVAIVMPVGFLAVNLAAGDVRFPNMFIGRKMDVDKAWKSQIWLMERMENGMHVLYTRPRRDEVLMRELNLLKSAGITRVWVTPKIPFMVPLFAGFVISAVFGNLLFVLFSL